jgi:CBS domain-containing protein
MPESAISGEISDLMECRIMLVETVLKLKGASSAVVSPAATAAEAAQLLAQQHIQIVLVCDANRRIEGVVTDSDILRAVARCTSGKAACCLTVSELMTRDVVTCRRDDRLDDVVATMLKRQLRRIPVVERDGTVAGLFTLREALLRLYEEAKLDEAQLKEYFLGIGYH